jgi:hypothetical protein
LIHKQKNISLTCHTDRQHGKIPPIDLTGFSAIAVPVKVSTTIDDCCRSSIEYGASMNGLLAA